MNRKRWGILLYVLIVGASLYIIFRWVMIMENPDEQTWINYVIIIAFILFTYINLKKLIRMIKNDKK